ncbi:hypothetical protein GCM10027594_21740 [Hymenobacter agri]
MVLQVTTPEVAKEFMQSFDLLLDAHSKFWLWLIFGIVIQIASALFSIFVQWRLKNIEKNVTKFNLREEKRIVVLEDIYHKMSDLTWFFPGESVEELNVKIQVIDRLVSSKRLYLSEELNRLIGRYLDHFRNVSANHSRKNIQKEEEMLDEFANIFNA